MGKELPARSSRGTRIRQLVGEEAEADEAFWGQAAWAEDVEDSDYATEEEDEDVVDSDFDEEEQPDEEVHGEDEDDTRRRARRGAREQPKKRAYQEPQLKQPIKRPRRGLVVETGGSSGGAPGRHEATPRAAAARAEEAPYEAPKLRLSTARKSSESSELRRKILEEAARLAAKAKKPQVAKTRLTQEQLLVEAVRTEVENTQSLNRLERLEEEKKAENAIAPKTPFTGLIVRYHSRIGMPKTISFLNTDEFPSIFNQPNPWRKERLSAREEIVDDGEEDDEEDEEDVEETPDEEGEEQTGESTADEGSNCNG